MIKPLSSLTDFRFTVLDIAPTYFSIEQDCDVNETTSGANLLIKTFQESDILQIFRLADILREEGDILNHKPLLQ